MNKIYLLLFIFFLPLLSAQNQIKIDWNTFSGSRYEDYGRSVAIDHKGNIYITGKSLDTWGKPLKSHTGKSDIFIAKYSPAGILMWNTFIGAANEYDDVAGIVVDQEGNVYIAGKSVASWGDPLRPYAGWQDVFLAKFDTNGKLCWNTFVGSKDSDQTAEFGNTLVVDHQGNIYVTGRSYHSWGKPINKHYKAFDTFIAKFTTDGTLLWNTFMGCHDSDVTGGIAIDSMGNTYVTGYSYASWGEPIHPHSSFFISEIFVAKIDSSGKREWNTFMGSTDYDSGFGIAVGQHGVYVSGFSCKTWGNPIRPHVGQGDEGECDIFVAKLDLNGVRQWNTFLGSKNHDDRSYSISVAKDSLFVSGSSWGAWGDPLEPHKGRRDGVLAKLDLKGNMLWHTFIGSQEIESIASIVHKDDKCYIVGSSSTSWASPKTPFSGDYDAYLLVLQLLQLK
ncbi:SBBP repeat-containing protein [Candidatus Uabimicrobium amorphum]|uniref:Beta-propeller repeat protein n=1 Tax=Uabimicrobium amorphum TaxID=2596890 RepID=A0A5S9F435_UABAM|nr:SBBP repeat-containing protein [Candidatus Uabimicrobium amorphum]BBM83802.1 hypothetical protein UABAM_02157 [Candidatus Uabimicrobium amorphum]